MSARIGDYIHGDRFSQSKFYSFVGWVETVNTKSEKNNKTKFRRNPPNLLRLTKSD
ncbi:MAG: hypothetical protein ACRC80_33345 [Waterburya sp.]